MQPDKGGSLRDRLPMPGRMFPRALGGAFPERLVAPGGSNAKLVRLRQDLTTHGPGEYSQYREYELNKDGTPPYMPNEVDPDGDDIEAFNPTEQTLRQEFALLTKVRGGNLIYPLPLEPCLPALAPQDCGQCLNGTTPLYIDLSFDGPDWGNNQGTQGCQDTSWCNRLFSETFRLPQVQNDPCTWELRWSPLPGVTSCDHIFRVTRLNGEWQIFVLATDTLLALWQWSVFVPDDNCETGPWTTGGDPEAPGGQLYPCGTVGVYPYDQVTATIQPIAGADTPTGGFNREPINI